MLEFINSCGVSEAAAISEALYKLSDVLHIVNGVNPMSPAATEIFIRSLATKAGARVNGLLEDMERGEM